MADNEGGGNGGREGRKITDKIQCTTAGYARVGSRRLRKINIYGSQI